METKIVGELNPIYSQVVMDALAEEGLRAYSKELNLDGWIKSVDIFLIYDTPDELDRARMTIVSLNIS